MKLIKLNNTGLYIIVDDYNTKEVYDSRITKGTIFYKDDIKDIYVAEYSPASKVSRPVISCNNPYSDAGIKNGNGLPEIDTKELNDHLKHYTSHIDLERVSVLADEYRHKHPNGNSDIMFAFEDGYNKSIQDNIDKRFTLEDMEKCFNDAKVALKFGGFEQYKKYLFWDEERIKVKTEWDIEIEMEVVTDFESRSDNDGEIFNSNKKLIPKINEQGFVKIIKIK